MTQLLRQKLRTLKQIVVVQSAQSQALRYALAEKAKVRQRHYTTLQNAIVHQQACTDEWQTQMARRGGLDPELLTAFSRSVVDSHAAKEKSERDFKLAESAEEACRSELKIALKSEQHGVNALRATSRALLKSTDNGQELVAEDRTLWSWWRCAP